MAIQGSRTGILWFRKDLRLHDNESLSKAIEKVDNIIPIYVFDKRLYEGETSYDFPKIAKYRKDFIIESVLALREALKERGSNLIIRYGIAEDEIYQVGKECGASYIFCNRDGIAEEANIQNKLEVKMWSLGAEMISNRGKMLFYTADMPFPVKHTPDTFTQFKKEVHKIVPVREPIPTPDYINTELKKIKVGDIPDELGSGIPTEKSGIGELQGGENVAIRRLSMVEQFLESDAQKNKKNGALERYYTSHLSPWISTGCLSPKLLYKIVNPFAEAKIYEAQKIIDHLLYRDFCRLMAKKYENQIFLDEGITGEKHSSSKLDPSIAQKFIHGKTGLPLIDALVRKLTGTGYLTTKSRRLLASFLVYDLEQPWLYGAEFFESMLIDYDPASNYGNWAIIANRYYETTGKAYINIVHQAEKFDPSGQFVKKWVPEIAKVDAQLIHYPWKWNDEDRRAWELPKLVYPEPIVKPRYSLV